MFLLLTCNKLNVLKIRYSVPALILFILIVFNSNKSYAQLAGSNVLGDAGLQSGSQASPSVMVYSPLYFYNAGKFKNGKGNEVNISPDLNVFLTGIGASYVSNIKILKANWGASIFIPFMSNRIESRIVNGKTPFSFTDMYVQPIQLGWHTKKADFIAGYALTLPTGKYEKGGNANTGLGMLSHEFSGGTTYFFDAEKSIHFSTLLAYEFHGKKKDSETKVGDILSIEGGLGKQWYKIKDGNPTAVFNAGMVYYMQFKTTSDYIPVGSGTLNLTNDHIYALGAEANVVLIKKSMNVIGIRWLAEFEGVNRFQGNTIFITFAHIFSTAGKETK